MELRGTDHRYRWVEPYILNIPYNAVAIYPDVAIRFVGRTRANKPHKQAKLVLRKSAFNLHKNELRKIAAELMRWADG
jgi:hypothetical protein